MISHRSYAAPRARRRGLECLGLVFTTAALWLLHCAETRAYSDPERFAAAESEGGGGGRYFTGSPADGYDCAVCHQGGVAPTVNVRGLPEDGYVPDKTYDLRLTWSNGKATHALQLEVMDRDGDHGGELELQDEDDIAASGRCDSDAEQEPAGYALPAGEVRQVLGVRACGSSSLRFRFTPADVPYVVFAGAMVRSDSSASPDGDGVISLSRVLRRAGDTDPPVVGSCAVVCARSRSRSLPLFALLGAFSWLFLARQRRHGTPP